MGEETDPRWQGVCGRSHSGTGARVSRNTDGTRQGVAVPESVGGREPGPFRAHEEWRVPGRREIVAGEDRHVVTKYEHARSDHVPDLACDSPSDGGQVVYLSDVRLHAWAIGFAGAGDALDVFAGICGPSADLSV